MLEPGPCGVNARGTYDEIDPRMHAEWGVDYPKFDWCNNEGQDMRDGGLSLAENRAHFSFWCLGRFENRSDSTTSRC